MKNMKALKVIIGLVASLALVYTFGYISNSQGYLKYTYINGIDCSGYSAKEAREHIIDQTFPNNNFDITYKDIAVGVSEYVIELDDETKLDEIYESQNHAYYIANLFRPEYYEVSAENSLDKLIDLVVNEYDLFEKSTWDGAHDAQIKQLENGKLYIIPELQGTEPDLDRLKSIICEHMTNGNGNLVIEEYPEIFEQPKVKQSDKKLQSFVKEVNDKLSTSVTYEYLGTTYKITPEHINKYMNVDLEKLVYEFREDEFVKDTAKIVYDTFSNHNKTYKLLTTKGDEVDIAPGNYGWEVDLKATEDELRNYIRNCTDITKEPVWKHQNGEYDVESYSKYIEVDLTNQHLYMHNNDKLIMESDIVSGNARNHRTPAGQYILAYKSRNATLRGSNGDGTRYASFVHYWMPFNGGIGFHDATWRSKFGGNIYTYNGSHGCINMPLSKAKILYENIDSEYIILCYWR